MMYTYLILDILFITIVSIALRLWRGTDWRRSGLVFLVLAVLTSIFDSLIIYFQIVGYDELKILGLRIGLAPVEDFAYPLLTSVLVPALWKLFQKPPHIRKDRGADNS